MADLRAVQALQAQQFVNVAELLDAAAEYQVPPEYLATLADLESFRGHHVFGHDQRDGVLAYPYAPQDVNVEVTEATYAEYRASLAEGKPRNGIGPLQVTHYSLQDDPAFVDVLWRVRDAIRCGAQQFARLLARYGDAGPAGAFARYRGLGDAGTAYAAKAMERLPQWRAVIEEASMATGYALLDQPNPTGPNYYTTRRNKILAIVRHITAGLQDLDATDDQSAEGVVRYAQTTTRDVSWHVSTDSDSTIWLLPTEYTAWHASDYNSCTVGGEISKLNTDWRNVPDLWRDHTLRQAARVDAAICRKHGIPIRKATRAEVDRELARGSAGQPVGIIGHWELDPDRRDDPGRLPGTSIDTFPWTTYIGLVQFYADGGDEGMTSAVGNLEGFVFRGGESTRVETLADLDAQGVARSSLFGRMVDVQLALTKMLPLLPAILTAAQNDAQMDPAAFRAVLDPAVRESVTAALSAAPDVNLSDEAVEQVVAGTVQRLGSAILGPGQAEPAGTGV